LSNTSSAPSYDAVVVGAGFAGLYMLHKLRQLGLRARLYEAGDGVGGTWFWNCYPGARCDVESMQYSYSFDEALQQEWQWSERYPAQREILSYINHVADRFALRPDIQLETRVLSADFEEAPALWRVRTDQGDEVTAQFFISAAGCLSAARTPDMVGLDDFAGLRLHTSAWPQEGVDLRGKRVGVIGTGSSGIQTIPQLAQQAGQLVVFQRTPNFSIPAWNRPLPEQEQQAWKQNYQAHREQARNSRSGILYDYAQRATFEVDEAERQAEYERRWRKGGANFNHCFNDIFVNAKSNELAAEFVRHEHPAADGAAVRPGPLLKQWEVHNTGAGAWPAAIASHHVWAPSAASAAAINPSFHFSRWTFQTPRPTRTTTAAAVSTVGIQGKRLMADPPRGAEPRRIYPLGCGIAGRSSAPAPAASAPATGRPPAAARRSDAATWADGI
jgi:cation diffusion facilitator CzcD-associated flavoprotein CzcO